MQVFAPVAAEARRPDHVAAFAFAIAFAVAAPGALDQFGSLRGGAAARFGGVRRALLRFTARRSPARTGTPAPAQPQMRPGQPRASGHALPPQGKARLAPAPQRLHHEQGHADHEAEGEQDLLEGHGRRMQR